MTNSKRTRLLGVAVVAVIASAGLAFACGSDDPSGSDTTCTAPDCDGGGAEGSVPEGATGDGPVPDGGMGGDADASPMEECDGAGAGTLDPTFGDGGMVWLKYPGAQAASVAVQADGKILVGGGTSPRKFALVRLLPNGTPDPTWGVNGLVETQIAKTYNYTYQALAIQPDGKIIAVGMVDLEIDKRSGDFAVVRYNPDGTLDTTFGQGGATFADFGAADFTADRPNSVALLPDGRIVVGGQSEKPGTGTADYAVARFEASGALDTAFGNAGKAVFDIHGTADAPGVIAVGAASDIVIAGGSSQTGDDPLRVDLTAVRINSAGQLDAKFGTVGKFATTVGTGRQRAYAISVDAKGRVLLAGEYSVTGQDFGLYRLTPSGAIDPSFGQDGAAYTDFGGRNDIAFALVIQNDGRFLVAGSSDLGSSTSGIATSRLLPDGELDPTYGDGGRSLVLPPANSDLSAFAMAASGCKFVTVGTWGYGNNSLPLTAMGIARHRR